MEEHQIKTINAREILDSRGNPTVEAEVLLETGQVGRASVPSGSSVGSHEAHELRDGDQKRYGGQGVWAAVGNIKGEIRIALSDKTFSQNTLDEELKKLDGTPDKSRLGANAILAVSLSFAKAAALAENLPLFAYFGRLLPSAPGKSAPSPLLPLPFFNLLNGGKHAEGALDVQEFMVVPVGASSFSESLRMGSEVFHALKSLLKDKGMPTTVGDEGGFAPSFKENEEGLVLLLEAITKAGFSPGRDVLLATDIAASELFASGVYNFRAENKTLGPEALLARYRDWTDRFHIISIEDPYEQNDWQSTAALTETLGGRVQIVGDDLFCTNGERLKEGVAKKAGNAILIKMNQIGTVSETIAVIAQAKEAGFGTIISHRSGETEDTSIAHLAVGTAAGQIKAGSLSRSERIAKYNELLRIEESLGPNAHFAGRSVFNFSS